jgi:hypothetical protein
MSAGIKANNDGSAAIQVGGSDYIEISATGDVAIPGTLTVGGIPAGGNYVLSEYTSPGTWDATTKIAAGLKAIKVTVVGAGGNGSTVSTVGSGGGGGGGGGAAIEYIPAPSIPGPVAVTAGPGTNSFGGFCSATAGASAIDNSAPGATLGANGGVGSGGNININGGGGGSGFRQSGVPPASTVMLGGIGGSSLLGGGGAGVSSLGGAVNTNGISGGNYGGGGSGAIRQFAGTATGGTGAPGIVIVEEFY